MEYINILSLNRRPRLAIWTGLSGSSERASRCGDAAKAIMKRASEDRYSSGPLARTGKT